MNDASKHFTKIVIDLGSSVTKTECGACHLGCATRPLCFGFWANREKITNKRWMRLQRCIQAQILDV